MKRNFYISSAVLIMLALAWSGCTKTEIVTATTKDVNIYEYLKQRDSLFSSYVKIIDKSGYAGFLNAYGSYTAFAPTNAGVAKYLKDVNKTLDALTEEEAKAIVKLHLLQDTLNSNSFKDGKLPAITMYGQYLLTGVSNNGTTSSYIINRQALVTQPNIRAGNGLIHTIDNVLRPPSTTLAKMIEADPDYSIFTQALKETGYYDSLNIVNNPDTTRRWLTVLAETNKALADSGITTYAALKAKYSKTGNPKLAADSLHLYVAYHILTDIKYLADIVTAPSHITLAPLEVVTSSLDDQTVLINDLNFNGVHEKGIVLERTKSDNAATNGVLHQAASHFTIKIRQPITVFWDVADFPEIRKLPSYFRKQTYAFPQGSIADYTWGINSISYVYNTASNFAMVYNDYLQIPLGLTNSARNKFIEMRTPLLVKGRYKVWIGYRPQKASTRNPAFPTMVSFDGKPLDRFMDFADGAPAGTEAEREALGWKTYVNGNTNTGYNSARLLGTIDVTVTNRHLIRLEAVSGAGQNENNLDMFHFIPVNLPQTRPLINKDGTLVP